MAWYHYLYKIEKDELANSCCFKSEQTKMKKGVQGWRQVLRKLCAVITGGILLNGARTLMMTGNLIFLFTYLTYWSLWFVFFTSIIGVYIV